MLSRPVQVAASRRGRRVRGFTIVELITVIVILGVLAALALPRFIDITGNAERAAIDGWVGGLKSAQGIAFAAAMVAGDSGYTSPDQMSLVNMVRCDNQPVVGNGGGSAAWRGHHLGLNGLRAGVFRDPDAMACAGNTISFTTQRGQAITITNSAAGISWVATPGY